MITIKIVEKGVYMGLIRKKLFMSYYTGYNTFPITITRQTILLPFLLIKSERNKERNGFGGRRIATN